LGCSCDARPVHGANEGRCSLLCSRGGRDGPLPLAQPAPRRRTRRGAQTRRYGGAATVSKTGKTMLGKTGTLAADRAAAAVRLRRGGYGYAAIARELGYAGPGGAYKAVRRGLRAIVAGEVDLFRALELERLDRLHLAHWERAIGGDVAAT